MTAQKMPCDRQASPRLDVPVPIASQVWPDDVPPLVSICCITYNHGRYIGQCLDGFLLQETTFPVEIIVHDDASTDGTADIIRAYASRYPWLIRPILQTVNQYSRGIAPNQAFVIPKTRGKYLALCEGDDYWLKEDKLSRQVELLENTPRHALCFTNSIVVDADGAVLREERVPDGIKRELTHADVVGGACPPVNTVVARRELVERISGNLGKIVNGDAILYATLTRSGTIGYIDEVTAAYRVHPGGVWANRPKEYILRNNLKTRKFMLDVVAEEEREKLLSLIYAYYNDYLAYCLEKNLGGDYVQTYLSFILFNLKHKKQPLARHLLWFRYGLAKIVKRMLGFHVPG